MKKLITIFILISFFTKAGNPPSIIFKENKGQWPEKVLFGTEIQNTKFYINKNAFNYCIYDPKEYPKLFGRHKKEEKAPIVNGHNYEVDFVGADLTSVSKEREQSEYYNYFLGKDKNKWASNVKAFGNLFFHNIYSGIDLKLYSAGINLKYDLIVKPNGNANSIKLDYKYSNGIELRNNELIIKTSVGEIIEKEPYTYQIINGNKIKIDCKYVLIDNTFIGFDFPNGYNKNYELIIDPTVVVCSYSGASNYAFGDVCTYDANGNIFVGSDADLGYPTTPGAFQLNGHTSLGYGIVDIVITEYNKSGTTKFFSTYIGGDYGDAPLDLAVANNEIVIYGWTISSNFPCTSNAMDTSFNSPSTSSSTLPEPDVTVSKLDLTGSTLLASTYIGGIASEALNFFSVAPWSWNLGEMDCDSNGNVYIIAATKSNNFPTTPGAISSTLKGAIDAVALKLDKSLTSLVWSTYLGGNNNESGMSIRADGSGGAYCFGSTTSNNFPTTGGAYNVIKNGGGPTIDLYISHIDSTGTNLIASTYLGTTGQDYASLMDLDAHNNVYLAGNLGSTSLLIPTPGTYSNAGGSNFIYKMNSSLSNILFKTKFGNVVSPLSPYLVYTALNVDSCGKIYVAGIAQNSFPTTVNRLQPYGGAATDIYVAQFNQNCSSLAFASFYGGADTNYVYPTGPIANPGETTGLSDFDNKGYFYSAIGISGGLPTTPGAYAMNFVPTATYVTYSTCNDAFLKIDLQTHINTSNGGNLTGCPPFTNYFVSATNTGTSYWNLGDGTTTALDTITHTYNSLGTYNVLLVVTDTNTCNRIDSIKSVVNVIPPTTFELDENPMACINSPAFIQSNVAAVTYSWSTGETTPDIYATPGTYTLTINNGGCNSSDAITVVIGEKKLSERFPNVVTANGDNINDFIDFKKYNFQEVELFIYDRWGREVFKTSDPNAEWHPDNLHAGTYYYVANYLSSCIGKYNTDKGFISIFK